MKIYILPKGRVWYLFDVSNAQSPACIDQSDDTIHLKHIVTVFKYRRYLGEGKNVTEGEAYRAFFTFGFESKISLIFHDS